MQIQINLSGQEKPEEVERLVGALVVLYDLQPKSVGVSIQPISVEATAGGLPTDITPPESPGYIVTEKVQQLDEPIGATSDDPDPSTLGFGELAQDAADLDKVGTPPPSPPPPANDEELDSAGQRWNVDIHASTKTKIGDGTWRRKPGVSPEKVAEAERVSNIPPPPPPPPPSAEGAPTTAAGFYDWAARSDITKPDLDKACVKVGLVDANGNGAPTLLMQRPEFVAALYQELKA